MTAGIGKIFHPRFASGEIPADPSSCPVCRGSHDADYSWTEPYFYTESGPHEYSDTRATSWIAAPSDKGLLVDERVRDRAIEVLGNISARRAAANPDPKPNPTPKPNPKPNPNPNPNPNPDQVG